MTKIKVLSGEEEDFDSVKIHKLLEEVSFNLGDLDLDQIVESVQRGLPSSLTIEELYTFIAEVIASRVIYHPDYAILAGRIETRKLYLKVPYSFSENVERLRKYRPRKSNSYSPISSAFIR